MFINGQTVLSACPHKPLGKDSQGVLKYISIIDLFRNFAKCFGFHTDEGILCTRILFTRIKCTRRRFITRPGPCRTCQGTLAIGLSSDPTMP